MNAPLSSLSLPPSLVSSLREFGFEQAQDVLELAPSRLARELGCSPQQALKARAAVRDAVECWMGKANSNEQGTAAAAAAAAAASAPTVSSQTQNSLPNASSALQALRNENSSHPIPTLGPALDRLLGGGVAVGELTEFAGVPGIGKTQLAIQLACDVQIPELLDGCGGQAVYIDTEGSFLPHRAAEVAQGLVAHLHEMVQSPQASEEQRLAAHSVTVQSLLTNIFCYRVYDHVEQLACIHALPAFLDEHPRVRLLVLDSVAFHFRRDFGSEDMARRSRLLVGMAQSLMGIARSHGLAVALTNQVATRFAGPAGQAPASSSGASVSGAHLVPALGESWAHCCTNSVILSRSSDGQRWARLLKSPHLPPGEAPYVITPRGVRGLNQALKRGVEEVGAGPEASSKRQHV